MSLIHPLTQIVCATMFWAAVAVMTASSRLDFYSLSPQKEGDAIYPDNLEQR